MAESSAATQSPSISSSSSGAEPSALGSGGSPGACPALGAKSCGSSCADSFPEQPAFLSKETGPAEEWIVKNQEPKNPNKVPSGEDRRALDLGQCKAEHVSTHSLSPSELLGASVEKDSPESPFEVIIDKATFDREFKDLYKESTNDLGGWTAHSGRESPADLLEMNDKVFPLRNKKAGRYPASALLSRQFSHTTAALQEVSRCVNDMHNFTNEILTWDLVPQAKQQADKSPSCTTRSTGPDRSEHRSEIPVINLKASTHQKMPVCSLNGNTPITKSTGDWAEASLSPESTVAGKPVKDYLSSTKEASGRGVPESPVSVPEKWVPGSGTATVEVALPDLRDAWPNSMLGEVTEVDSSGESEDTVIEDLSADPSFETNKVLPGKPASLPGAAAKTSGRGIKETPSCETLRSEMCGNSEDPSSEAELRGKNLEGASTVTPDLEQEQLTIRAIKELGERQAEQVEAEEATPGGKLKQAFAPQPWPQRSSDILEHTDIKPGSDLGISKKPILIKDTRVDPISSLSKTETVNNHVLARLLTDFSVRDLIFWRDVKKTGFVFGTTLIMLLSLAAFSVISVVSYLILALLSVTISFRVYKSVIQAVQKSEEGHPFKAYLDVDITLSSEAFHNYMNAAMVHVNRALKLVIRLFLVEDLVDSLKLAVFMWLMTYVGAVFNGITLLILAELLVFSVPIVYEKYKTQIDHYVGIARDQTKSIVENTKHKTC
ncbi:hypothetical protein ACRRTK_011454 [Alexandromys fortis]